VHVATYQTLGLDKEDKADATAAKAASFLTRHYPPDYFSHIVIDECHRSAWGSWAVILTRNSKAVQIGLTATPRKLTCPETNEEPRPMPPSPANNFAYFGEPVFEYGLAQAMEDGYLAACEIQLAQVNLECHRPDARRPDLPQPPQRQHRPAPFRRRDRRCLRENRLREDLLLPDRVNAMCLDLFTHLLAADTDRGPLQKTIIFCARDRHADDVASAMNNLYASGCKSKGTPRKPTTPSMHRRRRWQRRTSRL